MGQTLFDEPSLSGLESRLGGGGRSRPEVGLGKYAACDGTITECGKSRFRTN